MIDFLNHLVLSSDGIYGLRVIHVIMLCAFGWTLPSAIRDMKEIFNNKFLGSKLKNPNFMKLADAYGVVGMKAENPDVLKKSLKEAIAMNKTVLIEVPIGQMPSPF